MTAQLPGGAAKLESVEVAQSSNPVAYSVMATYMTTRERDSVGMWFRVIEFSL